ncbi:hypothetical protein ACQ4WX_34755 [Streptomyces lasalocidi]
MAMEAGPRDTAPGAEHVTTAGDEPDPAGAARATECGPAGHRAAGDPTAGDRLDGDRLGDEQLTRDLPGDGLDDHRPDEHRLGRGAPPR